MRLWPGAERFIELFAPEIILLQCGADSLDGDPLTDLRYTPAVHAMVARRLCALADSTAQGRLLALGGGGYDLDNLSQAWCRVIEMLLPV
jgi:acetoin utilization protein AcuC